MRLRCPTFFLQQYSILVDFRAWATYIGFITFQLPSPLAHLLSAPPPLPPLTSYQKDLHPLWVPSLPHATCSNSTCTQGMCPLGCCDHKLCDNSNFPLCFCKQLAVMAVISQLYWSNCNSPYNYIFPLKKMRTCVPGIFNVIFSLQLQQLSNEK